MKKIKYLLGILGLLVVFLFIFNVHSFKKENNSSYLEATVISLKDDSLTVQDASSVIYTFPLKKANVYIGDNLFIEYKGLLDLSNSLQDVEVLSYQEIPVSYDEDGVSSDFQDNGLFSDFYILANNYLKKLSLDEKIGELLLVRYPGKEKALKALSDVHVGGFVFYEKDFQNKTKKEVKEEIETLQENATTPLLTAVDEEGGEVVRVSKNPLLVSSPFLSSKELYEKGGFEAISLDTISKSKVLKDLGLNLNLAPVVDVSTNPSDYMYARSFQEDTSKTSLYAQEVIKSSKGTSVSYTLKHFPGYGNNKDTHEQANTDERSYEEIKKNDLPPFEAGIKQGAEAVLVSHNIVKELDSNPASLSSSIHNILRSDLNFTGIIMTDDLEMGAVKEIPDVILKALLAGNDLLMVTDYESSFAAIKKAVLEGKVSESFIDKIAFRVIAWKYYKGLMFESHK